VWLEVARVAYLEAFAGGYNAIREQGLEALTTEVHLRYHGAAYFAERLTVWTRCVGLRGARFRYEYRIIRGDEVVADGHTSHAVVRRDTYRPTRMPDWLSAAIAEAESGSSSTASRSSATSS
jgi:acyl-CoA thioester hydrolase